MSTSHAYLHPILGQPQEPRGPHRLRGSSEILFDDVAARHRGRYQRPDLTGYDTVSRPPRGHRHRRRHRHAEAADALGNRAGRAPAGDRDRRSGRLARRRLATSTTTSRAWCSGRPPSRWSRTSTQWWEIGLFTTVDEGLDPPDLMMHYGSVPFDMNTLRRGYPTTDNGFCLTPNVTQGRSRGTVRLRIARLPRPAAGRPALLHRPRGPRRADHARPASSSPARSPSSRRWRAWVGARAGARARRDDRRRAARLHPQDATTPSTTRRRTARMGAASRPDGGARSAAAGQGRHGAAGGRRVGDAEAAGGQPQHHGDDDGGEVCRPHPTS